jgi:hypothetical protein
VSFSEVASLAQRTDVNTAPFVPSNPSFPGNPGNEGESLVVINPTNPQNVVAFTVNSDADGNDVPMKSWYSFDGGLSYGESDIAYPPGHDPARDPAAAFDRAGNLYFVHLTKTSDPVSGYVSIAKSTSGGQTWAQATIVDTGQVEKCWIGVGPDPGNLNQDLVYVLYEKFGLRCASYNADLTLRANVAIPDGGSFVHLAADRTNGRLFAVYQIFVFRTADCQRDQTQLVGRWRRYLATRRSTRGNNAGFQVHLDWE